MARFLKKSKEEIGIAPDDLSFRGDKKINEVLLRIINFDANSLAEETIKTVKEVIKYQAKDRVIRFNIIGLHNTGAIEGITQEFNLDRLILADVMNTQVRPTIKEYDNCIYIPIKMLQNSSDRI